MTKKSNKKNQVVGNLSIKNLLLPIALFSISFLVKIVFISDKSNTNNVKIGETGEESNLSINQNNTQAHGLETGQIIFWVLIIVSTISLIYAIYSIYAKRNT